MAASGQEARAAPAPLSGPPLLLAGLILAAANFMVVLDTTIANVSVPHIAGSLAVSPSQGTWVITSYSVAEAITVPLTGWLAARFGTVKLFLGALTGFAVCSLLCGLAPTFELLVAGRVLQGLCGGPMMPASQTLLLAIFPRDKASRAMGLWSMTIVLAPVAGPLLGGYISDNLHWSWIFLINVPVAALIGVLGLRVLSGRDTDTRRVPVDYVGLMMLIVWVGALQVMLDLGKDRDWFGSPLIVGLGVVAAVGFTAFLIWELTSDNPIVDLRIFRHRGFTLGVVTLSLTFGTFFANVVLLPLYLQTTMAYTATWAAYTTALNGVSALVASPIAARLSGKVDLRALVFMGVVWMGAVFFWRSTFTMQATYWQFALPQLVLGFGMPFFFVPGTQLTLLSVRPEETASAAGLQNFLRTLGAAFATSIMTTSWENIAAAKRTELAGAMTDTGAAVNALTARGLTHDQAVRQIDGLVQQQAMTLSTDQLFLIGGAALVLAASFVWLAPKTKGRGSGPGPGGH